MNFNFRATEKATAKAEAAIHLDGVVANEPAFSAARATVLASIESAIDLLSDDTDQDVSVVISGSVAWHGEADAQPPHIVGVTLSCSVGLSERWNPTPPVPGPAAAPSA